VIKHTTTFTATIVTSYVGSHQIAPNEIPALLKSAAAALSGLGQAALPAPQEKAEPAAPVKKSVTPEYIACLEDRRKLKMLKLYLRTTYGMTPDDYREVGPACRLSDGGAELCCHARRDGQGDWAGDEGSG
jgi:predicted transcriptional regulator